jgi:hypothetical protein
MIFWDINQLRLNRSGWTFISCGGGDDVDATSDLRAARKLQKRRTSLTNHGRDRGPHHVHTSVHNISHNLSFSLSTSSFQELTFHGPDFTVIHPALWNSLTCLILRFFQSVPLQFWVLLAGFSIRVSAFSPMVSQHGGHLEALSSSIITMPFSSAPPQARLLYHMNTCLFSFVIMSSWLPSQHRDLKKLYQCVSFLAMCSPWQWQTSLASEITLPHPTETSYSLSAKVFINSIYAR